MESISEIARKRIGYLLSLAKEVFHKDAELSVKYVTLARKIATGHRLKVGNRTFCKKCNYIFIPGTTLKVRQSPGQKATLYICTNCGAVRKFARKK